MQPNQFFVRSMGVILSSLTIAAIAVAAVAADDGPKPTERQLIAVLQSNAPAAEKAITCKRLAIFGSKDAIPALAPLLTDKQLASWARIALEAIPGPQAGEALRGAMGKVKGRLLVGVINSIGVRGDTAAAGDLAGRLKDADTNVACAAGLALGRIGTEAASATLRTSLTTAPPAVRSAVAEGLILCAERRLADHKGAVAIELYDAVRKADLPKQRILEATRGAILARKSEGIPLLVEQLRSSDKQMFQIALTTARELAGRGVTIALAGAFSIAKQGRGALLLAALADRGDKAAGPAVLQAAKRGPKNVRIAAIGVLEQLGDAASVPALLAISTETDEQIASAAKTTLARLSGKDVDSAIAGQLSQAKGKLLPTLIGLIGQRRIAATAALKPLIEHPDTQVRRSALTALGATIGQNDLLVLIGKVTAPKHQSDTPAAVKALKTASIRMPDREACAAQLSLAMSQADLRTKPVLLEILGAVGGTKALEQMAAAGKDHNPQLQDAATRLLGQWMSVEAAATLLDLAKTAPADKYKIRSLRGYIRLVRQFPMPDSQRAQMCSNALNIAKRDAERKLVLEVIKRYPSIEMLRVAVEATKNESLKDEATNIALAIAQKVGGGSRGAAKLLAEIGQEPVKLEIVRAEYGAGDKHKDVTAIIRRHAKNLRLIALPSPSYNSALGGDPAPGVTKKLTIEYRINGKPAKATFAENDVIILPLIK